MSQVYADLNIVQLTGFKFNSIGDNTKPFYISGQVNTQCWPKIQIGGSHKKNILFHFHQAPTKQLKKEFYIYIFYRWIEM